MSPGPPAALCGSSAWTVRDGTRIRSRIGGVIPQADTLDQELTVLENLLIYGRYFGLGKREARLKAAELLDFAQLQDKADAKSPLSPAACDGG